MKRCSSFTVRVIGALAIAFGCTPSSAQNAYIPNNLDNTVSVIDTVTDTVVGSPIPVGGFPSGVAVARSGKKVYVSNFNDSTVSVIDAATNAVTATIPLGECPNPPVTDLGPAGVVVSPDGRKVYVASGECRSLLVIDTATDTVIATVPVGIIFLFGIAISPDGSNVYVTGERGNVYAITTATNTVTNIQDSSRMKGIAVSPNGRWVYATEVEGLGVIDTATDAFIDHVTIPDGGADRYGVAVSPDGKKVYVTTYQTNSVSVIDTATNTVVGSPIPVGSGPYGVAVTPDGRKIFVANELGGTVSVIDAVTGTVVTALPVGSQPTAFGVFIQPRFAGTPGARDCRGVSILALAETFGGLHAAANALGFPTVEELGNAIDTFCAAGP